MNEVLNQIHWPDVLSGGAIGFVVALLVAAIFEWVRKPNLTFEIDSQGGTGERDIGNDSFQWKFTNIIVHNKKRPFYESWLFGNIPAENCRAWIIFRDYKNNVELVKMSARWNSTGQPLLFNGIPDLNSILVASRDSIPVAETAGLAVAIKTNKSDSIFGFNNESYLYYPTHSPDPYNSLWSKPEYEVGKDKKYKVCIKVLANGHEYKEEFYLVNPSRLYSSFKLIEKEREQC